MAGVVFAQGAPFGGEMERARNGSRAHGQIERVVIGGAFAFPARGTGTAGIGHKDIDPDEIGDQVGEFEVQIHATRLGRQNGVGFRHEAAEGIGGACAGDARARPLIVGAHFEGHGEGIVGQQVAFGVGKPGNLGPAFYFDGMSEPVDDTVAVQQPHVQEIAPGAHGYLEKVALLTFGHAGQVEKLAPQPPVWVANGGAHAVGFLGRRIEQHTEGLIGHRRGAVAECLDVLFREPGRDLLFLGLEGRRRLDTGDPGIAIAPGGPTERLRNQREVRVKIGTAGVHGVGQRREKEVGKGAPAGVFKRDTAPGGMFEGPYEPQTEGPLRRVGSADAAGHGGVVLGGHGRVEEFLQGGRQVGAMVGQDEPASTGDLVNQLADHVFGQYGKIDVANDHDIVVVRKALAQTGSGVFSRHTGDRRGVIPQMGGIPDGSHVHIEVEPLDQADGVEQREPRGNDEGADRATLERPPPDRRAGGGRGVKERLIEPGIGPGILRGGRKAHPPEDKQDP